ncbi:hypothetical protein [Haloplanus salilacus]|uniref:hypothetical protein n=1 Tax=Haloplanus salilacus TaxID=2949994 RepID=UPI0030D52C86
MNPNRYPAISRAKERDTTFLVVELLASSSEFRTWFFDQLVANPAEAQFLGVMRSVETHGRETDIRVEFDTDGTRHLALVENKLDAAFGERQISDYYQRTDQYVQEGRCDRATVVLLAPANRADAVTRDRFDHTITYEQIRDQLRKVPHDSTPFAEEVFRIALIQEGETDKSNLMATLTEQLKPVLQEIAPHLELEATENRIRIKSSDPEFPSIVWYEIRAKFSALGTIAPGIRVSTDDSNELRAIHQVLESQYDDLPLDSYRVELADNHRKKQGMVEWVLEVPGDPEAISDGQIQQVVNAMQTIIEHYHDSLRDVVSE